MNIPCAISIDVEGDYWDKNTTLGVIHGLPLILDLFKRLEIKGSFFWTAETAQNHPDILERSMIEGHEIGCHGLHHENFQALSKTQQSKIVKKAARILRSLGADCKGFRAPRLQVNNTFFQVLSDHGFSYDSSVPFWGIRRYKYGKRYDRPALPELKCIPSYSFRIFHNQFPNIVSRSFDSLGYFVFFFHPWEVIKPPKEASQMPIIKRLNLINTLKSGPGFLTRLESYLQMTKERFFFQTCLELSNIVEMKPSTYLTGY